LEVVLDVVTALALALEGEKNDADKGELREIDAEITGRV
jgi:hypothetical protein